MSEYFLKLPGDSRPKAYSEYEVREMLGQGIINSQILTWKQGMEGWQPLDQVLPDLKMPPLPQQQFTATTILNFTGGGRSMTIKQTPGSFKSTGSSSF